MNTDIIYRRSAKEAGNDPASGISVPFDTPSMSDSVHVSGTHTYLSEQAKNQTKHEKDM